LATTQWYYGQGDKELGPIASEQLKQLAISGELGPQDMVWKEGMPNWVEAGSIQGLFAEAAPPKSASPQIQTAGGSVAQQRGLGTSFHLLDYLLIALRSAVPARMVEQIVGLLATIGGYCLLAYIGLYLLFSLCYGVKIEQIDHVVGGAAMALFLIALHYAAWRFIRALDSLIKATPSQLNSTAVPDVLGLIFVSISLMMLALGIFSPDYVMGMLHFVGITITLDLKWVIAIVGGIGFMFWFLLMAMICIHPESLNIKVSAEDTSAGQEAIGVIAFIMKATARVTAAAFGVGVVCATGTLLLAFVPLFQEGKAGLAILAASASTGLVKWCGLLPLLVYFSQLLWFITVDVVQAIISLPGKLDRISEENRG
jgi:hypothetical protein